MIASITIAGRSLDLSVKERAFFSPSRTLNRTAQTLPLVLDHAKRVVSQDSGERVLHRDAPRRAQKLYRKSHAHPVCCGNRLRGRPVAGGRRLTSTGASLKSDSDPLEIPTRL